MAHARELEAERGTAHARGYTTTWAQLRASYLRRHPGCAQCGAPATQVHHRRRLRDGGGHSDANLEALCHRCHSARTAREDSGW